MFFVKAHGKVHKFNNSDKDDFIQFLPAHFGCAFEELEIMHVPQDVEEQMRRQQKIHGKEAISLEPSFSNNAVALYRSQEEEIVEDDGHGKPNKVKKTVKTMIRAAAAKPVTQFPYAGQKSKGKRKFMGIK